MPPTATQAPPADAERIVAVWERGMSAYPWLYRPDSPDDGAAAYRLARWFLQTDLDAS